MEEQICLFESLLVSTLYACVFDSAMRKCLLRFAAPASSSLEDHKEDTLMPPRHPRGRIFASAALIALTSVLGATGGSLPAHAAGIAVGPSPVPVQPASPLPIGQTVRPDPSPVPRPPIPPVSLLKVRPPNVPLPPLAISGSRGYRGLQSGRRGLTAHSPGRWHPPLAA